MSISIRCTIAVLAVVFTAGIAVAQSEGPNSPATVVSDASIGFFPWASPGNAAASDNAYTFSSSGSGFDTQYLKATGYGFTIPASSVIVGIEVDIERQSDLGMTFDNAVRIVKGGVIGATDRSDAVAWPALMDATVTHGSPTDLWGETWTPADINAAGFGAAVSAGDAASGDTARVDHMTITVYYAFCGEPLPGCRTSLKGTFIYRNKSPDTKDKLVWKWIKGQATTFGEFGTPTASTEYTLCIYAGTTAIADPTIVGGSGNWSVIGANKGYKYKDVPAGTSDGITKAILKTSAVDKAKALVKGKGVNLPDSFPATPFPLPITVQLVNDANSICFSTVFTTAKKNSGGIFKAKLP